MRTHCSPNPCRHLLSLFFLIAAVLAGTGQYLIVAFICTPLVDGIECFLSPLAICISSFEKSLTLSLNILKVMQTGEMKKKTKAWLHTNFLQQKFHCLSHVIFSEKPRSECCPVILPGNWAVRDIFSHAWPVHQQLSHSHSTMWLWCQSQLWMLSDQANVAHRIMSSRNCLLLTSLSSRI